MEENNNKKIVVLVITLLVLIVGAGITFAYFSVNVRQDESITVDVTTSDKAKITYANGSNLNLIANQPGTTATSYFNVRVEGDGKGVTGVYDIYWEISTNSFVHDDTNDKELIYSLFTSSDNQNWTPIIIQADATGLTGSIKLAGNEIISSSNANAAVKYYKFEVTYPNLSKDQSYNMEKELQSYIEIRSSM